MPFHITHICFNEPEYVILHPVKIIMAENDAKITENTPIMVFSY